MIPVPRFPLIGSLVMLRDADNFLRNSAIKRSFITPETAHSVRFMERIEFEYVREPGSTLFRVDLRRVIPCTFRVHSVVAVPVVGDTAVSYEVCEEPSEAAPYLKDAKFRRIFYPDPPSVNLFEDEKDQSSMPKNTEKVSGKQAAMLLARAASAGYKTEVRFLEWLEYESGLRLNYEAVEEIDACFVNDILQKLSS